VSTPSGRSSSVCWAASSSARSGLQSPARTCAAAYSRMVRDRKTLNSWSVIRRTRTSSIAAAYIAAHRDGVARGWPNLAVSGTGDRRSLRRRAPLSTNCMFLAPAGRRSPLGRITAHSADSARRRLRAEDADSAVATTTGSALQGSSSAARLPLLPRLTRSPGGRSRRRAVVFDRRVRSRDSHSAGRCRRLRRPESAGSSFRLGTIAALWFALDGAAASTRQSSSRRRETPLRPGASRSDCPS
jgi:hypothetical protein